MFSFSQQRMLNMTAQELRWFDNIKKAFFQSDQAIISGDAENCLEPLMRAVDTAKTLRRSLKGESVDERYNKERFTTFLDLDVPPPGRGGLEIEIVDSRTGKLHRYSFSGLAYAIRCMIHENENLNHAEWTEYHISLNWSEPHSNAFGCKIDEKLVLNGFVFRMRIREVLAKFVTGIEGTRSFHQTGNFSITCAPPLGSIKPVQKRTTKDVAR